MRRPFTRRGRYDAADHSHEAPGESRLSIVRFIVTVMLLAWALRSFVIAPFSIPSGSMLPTLYIGDYLIVAKWPYGYSRHSFPWGLPSFPGRFLTHLPARGDVVVFRHPVDDNDLIKRVIGLPGDTVAVRGGVLVLNGRVVVREQRAPYAMPVSANTPCKVVPPASAFVAAINGRPYCRYQAFRERLPNGPSYTVFDQVEDGPADEFGPTTVPPGRVFLMGDNRDDSLDSRFSRGEGGIGMVPIENLIGRAMVTFWSTDGSASYWKPWTWFSALRGSRIGNNYKGDAE
jgi:signal peptidase I